MPELHLRDGHRLAWQRRGEGPALLLLHGFTGAGDAFPDVALDALAGPCEVITVDLPGHGRSSRCHDPQRFALDEIVRDLCEVCDALELEAPIVGGYSMGARVALGFACRQPARVSALVLESGSPGLAAADERAARVAADETLARRLEREPLARFVDDWMALPLFASQRALPAAVLEAERKRRLDADPASLAACLRGLGTGTQPSFWSELERLELPVLLLTGSLDTKFDALAAQMHERLPRARRRVVTGVGHAIHLEAPEAWAAEVAAFVRDAGPSAEENFR